MLRFYCLLLVLSGYILPAAGQITYRPFDTPTGAPRERMRVRPGQTLRFELGNINRFKYKTTITSTYFTREFDLKTAPTSPATTGGANDTTKKKGTDNPDFEAVPLSEKALIAQAARARFDAIRTSYTAYKQLMGTVNRLYAADTWPDDIAATLIPDAKIAFNGSEQTITAGQIVSCLNLWHQQLITAITEYTTQTEAFAAEAARHQDALNTVGIARDKAKSAYNKTKKTTAKDTLYAIQARINAIDSKLKQANGYIAAYPTLTFADKNNALAEEMKAWLDQEAKQPLLPTLASAYLAMRTMTAPLPPPTTLQIPYGKDEMDLEIKLEPNPTYQVPPGTAPVVPDPPFKRTLYIVPRFRITASVGPYVGGLFDQQFVLANDSLGQEGPPAAGSTTPTVTYSPRRRIVRDNADQKFAYVGATVLTHFEYHLRPAFGIALSLGAGLQTSGFRALLGPSLLVGTTERVVISGGVQLGQVKRLSTIYKEGDKVPVSLQTVPTRDVNATSWFAALTYNLTSARK